MSCFLIQKFVTIEINKWHFKIYSLSLLYYISVWNEEVWIRKEKKMDGWIKKQQINKNEERTADSVKKEKKPLQYRVLLYN